ncbi:hypothetical protein ACJX0J_020399 [Zea mays]
MPQKFKNIIIFTYSMLSSQTELGWILKKGMTKHVGVKINDEGLSILQYADDIVNKRVNYFLQAPAGRLFVNLRKMADLGGSLSYSMKKVTHNLVWAHEY